MWVVAHRGASGHAPENTLAAFRRAIELGARFIETDLHVTRDARLVAIHDATLERTTNGSGPVHEHTLEELRRLDAGSWFAPEFSGERLPTIEEIIALAHESDVSFYLELKARGAWGVEHAVVSALRQGEATARIVVLSFDVGQLAVVRRLEPTLMTGLLSDRSDSRIVERALEVGARQLAPRGDLVTPELVEQARRADLQVVVWTINAPDQMRALVAAGVDGIMTDYPDRLAAVLQS